MGVFDKIKQSLTRTTQQFLDRFDEVVTRADAPERRSRPVDVETIEALEEILISADVGVAATGRIVEAVKRPSAATARRCAIWSSARSSASSARPIGRPIRRSSRTSS